VCVLDIDECSSVRPPCTDVALCVNTPGSFDCSCPAGYKLDADQRTCRGQRLHADHRLRTESNFFSPFSFQSRSAPPHATKGRPLKQESLRAIRQRPSCQTILMSTLCSVKKYPLLLFCITLGKGNQFE